MISYHKLGLPVSSKDKTKILMFFSGINCFLNHEGTILTAGNLNKKSALKRVFTFFTFSIQIDSEKLFLTLSSSNSTFTVLFINRGQ